MDWELTNRLQCHRQKHTLASTPQSLNTCKALTRKECVDVRAGVVSIVMALSCLVPISPVFAQEHSNDKPDFPAMTGPYMGQKPPGMKPELFAPKAMNAEHGYHTTIVFSPDLAEAFWSPMERESRLLYSKMVDGRWTRPQIVDCGLEMGVGDPALSPDGNRLYFLSFQPPRPGDVERERIWYMERSGAGWSAPHLIDKAVLAHPMHWVFSFAENGNLYFGSEIEGVRGEQDIYIARSAAGRLLPPQDLGDAVNGDGRDMAPFIAPDESYLIFTRLGRDTKKTDLYISYKDSNGKWTRAVDMGENINTEHHDLCPYVSPDGKYLFFLSQREGRTNRMYWVDSGIIEDLKPKALKQKGK